MSTCFHVYELYMRLCVLLPSKETEAEAPYFVQRKLRGLRRLNQVECLVSGCCPLLEPASKTYNHCERVIIMALPTKPPIQATNFRESIATGITVDGRNAAPVGIHGKPLFVGSYRGIILSGFARWCRISSVHSILRLVGKYLRNGRKKVGSRQGGRSKPPSL